MSAALISPALLRWARERSHMEPDFLAEKAHVKLGNLLLWEKGDAKPTFKQAQDIAHVLHIPFGFLFLIKPPEETLQLPDLRTVGDRSSLGQFSIDLKDILSDVLRKQDWYREYLLEQGKEHLPYIGKFTVNENVKKFASDITTTLQITKNDRTKARNWTGFLKLLMERAEDVGVWVICSGKVGTNTSRILDVDEFRGFAISDTIAPIVFINGADAKAAQIFTLVHELAHLWLGKSGVSDVSLKPLPHENQNRIEKLCNEVAAEVLVPQDELKEHWQSEVSVFENTDALASFFCVSAVVIARRALDLGLISKATFLDFYKKQVAKWKIEKEKKESGGSFFSSLPIANGRRFTKAVIQSVYQQTLLMRDGAKLLGISPSNLNKLAGKMDI